MDTKGHPRVYRNRKNWAWDYVALGKRTHLESPTKPRANTCHHRRTHLHRQKLAWIPQPPISYLSRICKRSKNNKKDPRNLLQRKIPRSRDHGNRTLWKNNTSRKSGSKIPHRTQNSLPKKLENNNSKGNIQSSNSIHNGISHPTKMLKKDCE